MYVIFFFFFFVYKYILNNKQNINLYRFVVRPRVLRYMLD